MRAAARKTRRFSRVWDVPARTAAITELGEQLHELGIEKVTVESTSDYWRIFYYLLEAAGLSVQLVNARDVKHVPGRPKTDKLDAVWLAKLTEKGLLRPSFVPPAEIRRLRDYTRMREDLTRDRTRYWQRLEKLLEDALIKISSVASTMITLSTRDMVEALIAGERDPYRLAELARGKMKAKRAELITALDGRFDDHHAELARMLLNQSTRWTPRSTPSPGASNNSSTSYPRTLNPSTPSITPTTMRGPAPRVPTAIPIPALPPAPRNRAGSTPPSRSTARSRPNAHSAPWSASMKSQVSARSTPKTSWPRSAPT